MVFNDMVTGRISGSVPRWSHRLQRRLEEEKDLKEEKDLHESI